MKYIMVTHWEDHWDRLRNDRSWYTKDMLKEGMDENKLENGTKTIFIKIDKIDKETKLMEKCWIGKVHDFDTEYKYKDRSAVSFRVEIEDEITCPEEKYRNYSEGWYCEEEPVEPEIQGRFYDPGFFKILTSTSDWREFEKYTYYLLKILGIHRIHKFDERGQRGKADGFFTIGHLAVLYDATLEGYVEENREVQIFNLCAQLRTESIKFDKRKHTISGKDKQVWIITRNTNPRIIMVIDDIIVKEVPVNKIMEFYRKRLDADWDESQFEKELRDL